MVRFRALLAAFVSVVFTTVALVGTCLACTNVPTSPSSKHCCNKRGGCEKPTPTRDSDHKDCSSQPADLAKIEKTSPSVVALPLTLTAVTFEAVEQYPTPAPAVDSSPPSSLLSVSSQLRI